jgi:hypothetical protein
VLASRNEVRPECFRERRAGRLIFAAPGSYVEPMEISALAERPLMSRPRYWARPGKAAGAPRPLRRTGRMQRFTAKGLPFGK